MEGGGGQMFSAGVLCVSECGVCLLLMLLLAGFFAGVAAGGAATNSITPYYCD